MLQTLCLSFSQNVEWHHRFQATFGGPIRMSVFFTLIGSLFAGWILSTKRFTKKQKYSISGVFGTLLLLSAYFSHIRKLLCWECVFAIICFVVLKSYKYVYGKKNNSKVYTLLSLFSALAIISVAIWKWELFLHPGAILNRMENLSKSLEMFFYNPIGYGLGIAGPASQIGHDIESAGNWQIATSTTTTIASFSSRKLVCTNPSWTMTHRIWNIYDSPYCHCYSTLTTSQTKKRFSFCWDNNLAYFALCFMALFTHAFEEAASSFSLFLSLESYFQKACSMKSIVNNMKKSTFILIGICLFWSIFQSYFFSLNEIMKIADSFAYLQMSYFWNIFHFQVFWNGWFGFCLFSSSCANK